MAFSIPTLYTITLKLPFNMSDRIYDIEQSGKPKLEKIIKIISRARVKASARSTDQTNNTSTKNNVSTHLTSPVNPALTMANSPDAAAAASASPTSPTHRYSSWAELCRTSGRLYPTHEDVMINANYQTPREFKSDGIGRTNPDCRVCKHLEATGNHKNGLYVGHFANYPTHCPLWAAMDFENREKIIWDMGMCSKCLNPRYTMHSRPQRKLHETNECSVAKRKRKNKFTCLNEECFVHSWVCNKHRDENRPLL